MNRQIGILMTIITLLMIGMTTNVFAGSCSASSCTPVCGWVYPNRNDMSLGEETVKTNTTMVTAIQETTTSGFNNITEFVITPYQNSSNTLNSTQNGTSVIFDNLDDGDYKLTAIIFYDNASAEYQNLTVTQVDCGSRSFRVNTRTGSANYPELIEEVDGTIVKKDTAKEKGIWLFAGLIAVIVILAASKKFK